VTLRIGPLLWMVVVFVLLSTYIVYRVEHPDHITATTVILIIETTVTIVGAIYAIFVNFAWHWNLFRGWLVCVPDFRGTWTGSLTPLDPDGKPLQEIACTLTVKQKLHSITCVLETEGSRSQSISGNATLQEETNEALLVYVYEARPKLADLKANPGHQGTVELRMDDAQTLTGTYFTNRCTRGTLCLKI
jgi:hypothetical protein